MSDFDHRRRFESWLAKEMHRPIRVDANGPERVMALVRANARPARRPRALTTPATAFAFAACVVGVIAFRMATLLVPTASFDRSEGRDAGLRDTISAFRDSMESTARLVGIAVIAPAAARIAVAHDFHGWDLRIAPARGDERAGNGTLSVAPGLQLSPVNDSASGIADASHLGTILDSVPERR
jgi:hypothetical protein